MHLTSLSYLCYKYTFSIYSAAVIGKEGNVDIFCPVSLGIVCDHLFVEKMQKYKLVNFPTQIPVAFSCIIW